MGPPEIADRRNAALQELRDSHSQRRSRIFRADLEDRHEFIERALTEAGTSEFLQHSLPAGLMSRMAVNVDEAWHQHHPPSVDLGIGRAAIVLADMDDAIAADHEIGVTKIDVRSGILVPGDDPVAVAEQGGCLAMFVRHEGIP
jgi:hypothetical protein